MSKYSNKTMLFFGAAILAVLFVTYAALTRVNFMGDMVLRQIEKAVNEQLRAEISVSPFKGNPLAGLRGDGLVVSRSGDVLLSADSVAIDISLPSLLTGSARVGRLTIDGLRSDYDSLLAMLPEKGADTGPRDIPIDKVVVNRSLVDTPWGPLEFDNSTLRPHNTEKLELDFSGVFREAPAAFSGFIEKKEGNWTLRGVKLRLADGTAAAEGPVFPSPDLTLTLKNLDLERVAAFVPELGGEILSGSVGGNMKITGLQRDMRIHGEGTLKDAVIAGIALQELKAEWDYSPNKIWVKIHKGNIFKSSLTGDFRLDREGNIPYLTMKATVNDLNFSDWTKKTGFLGGVTGGARENEAQHFSGVVTSLDAELEGPLNALTGYADLAPSSFSYKTMKLTEVKGRAVFSGKPSGAVNFSAKYRGGGMTLAGELGLASDAVSDLRFNAASLAMEELGPLSGALKKYSPKGAVDVSATLTGKPGEWTLRGSVASEQITEARYGTFKKIRLNPEYRFNGSSLLLSDSSAEWNGAEVTARGVLPLGATPLDLTGSFKNAATENFQTLLPVFKTLGLDTTLSGRLSVGGTFAAPTVRAELAAERGRLRGLAFGRTSGRLDYVPGKLTLSPLSLGVDGGKAVLALEVLFPRNAAGTYLPALWDAKGDLSNIPASALNGLFGLEQPLDGALYGAVSAGNGGGGLGWSFDARGKNLSWSEFRADEAMGKIYGDASAVNIEDLRLSFLRSDTIMNGRITLPGGGQADGGALDITVTAKRINVYELLRRHILAVRGFQGLIEASARITGTVDNPLISGEGTIAPLRYRSFLLPMVDVRFGGTLREITGAGVARLKGGTLNADARFWQEAGKWNAELAADAREINLRQIGRYLPEDFREKLDGSADITLKGGGQLGSFSGSGTFKSGHMRIWGVDVNDINAPFYVSDGFAIMEDVRAKSSGGEVSGGGAIDMANNLWGGNLSVLSADVSTFMKQSVPQVKGSVTGKGDFSIRTGGEMGRLSTVRASGVLKLRNGTLSGFKAVEAAQKFTRGNPLRFETVQATFGYSGGFLTIMPGSQAIAPRNDPVYRYAMLDGTIDKNGTIALFAMGKANIQALNALLGAIQGLMELDINLNEPLDTGELLQGIIGGALSGFSRSDFRFVTMGIRGTYDAPRFENVLVQSGKKAAHDAIPKTSSDPKEDTVSDHNTTFRFRFEIPVGPGVPASRSGLDDQARGQILRNALDGLIRNNDF